MISTFIKFVSLRYLRPQKNEGFTFLVACFSFFGMMLGVATLIIVMSVMNGFREELFAKILGVNGHLSVYDMSLEKSYDDLANKLEDIEGVEIVTPLIQGQVLITGPRKSQGALVKGIQKEKFHQRDILRNSFIDGQFEQFKGKDKVILGYKLAESIGAFIGDTVTLVSPQRTSTPFGFTPRNKTYTVIGLSKVDMYEFDSSTIYMPLEAAQLFFQLKSRVSELDVFVKDPDRIDDYYKDIRLVLPLNTRIVDWKQRHQSFYNVLQVERTVMFVILALIIIVAAFNIISSLIMLVRSKQKDIAILRTIGASKRMILKIFMMTGAFIGVSGTVFGVGLGLVFCANIKPIFETVKAVVHRISGTELFDAEFYYLSSLPAIVNYQEVIGIALMSLLLTFLSTLYPAWRAAKLDPVKALRYE